MNFALRYTPEAKEGLELIERVGLKSLAEKILIRLGSEPFVGKRLVGPLNGIYSARITRRYRILYKVIRNKNLVIILDIAHRKEIYG